MRSKATTASRHSLAHAASIAAVDDLEPELEVPESPIGDAALAGEADLLASELAAATLIEADFQLAKRCVAGDVAAWEQLHSQCHESLLAMTRRLLRGRSNDTNLADEIVAQVWYALVANDGELLLRFDPRRGARLMTFLRAIARDLLSRHFRSEYRRMGREYTALLDKPRHHAADLDHVDISLEEFLGSLAPGERQFYDDYLEQSAEREPERDLTRANVWQKTHRLYDKFRGFFGHGG